MAVTVVIVDDHAGFRRAARAVLESDGFVILGEAWDARSGYDLVASVRPDVALLDIGLPDEDGFELTDRLLERADPPIVVLISGRDRPIFQDRLDRSGARGFIAKRELTGATLGALVRDGTS
jgi:DNA-binding NarL/FixJ family response regulator